MERAAHLVNCEECLWSWFSRLMGALSRAIGGKNEGGSGRSRGSGIKSHNRKREVPFFGIFSGRGEETLSKIGEDLKERQP